MAVKGNLSGHVDESFSFRPIGNLSDRTKYILSIIFLIIIIVEASFLYWQFGAIYTKKSAKDVSEVSFTILIVTNIVWLIFGIFVLGSIPIIISGALYTIGASLVLGARLYYKDGKNT